MVFSFFVKLLLLPIILPIASKIYIGFLIILNTVHSATLRIKMQVLTKYTNMFKQFSAPQTPAKVLSKRQGIDVVGRQGE
jgi:hypothetical protein